MTAPPWLFDETLEYFTVVSGMNLREHHMGRARRVAKERGRVAQRWLKVQALTQFKLPAPPYVARLTRLIGHRGRDLDEDNLVSGLKSVRDELSRILGIDDKRDPNLSWEVAQEKGTAFAVRIQLRQRAHDEEAFGLRVVRPRDQVADTMELPLQQRTLL